MEPKDWVAIVTAVIGCIIGIAAFIRSGRVDRRTRLEPYFVNIWPGISEWIGSHLNQTESWLNEVETKAKKSNEYLPSRKRSSSSPDLNKFDWSYDRSLRKALGNYLECCEALSRDVSEFNNFYDPSSKEFADNIILEESPEDSEAVRTELKRRRENAEKIANKYAKKCDNSWSLQPYSPTGNLRAAAPRVLVALRQNKSYQRQVSLMKTRVLRQAVFLRKTIQTLSPIIRFYDVKFNKRADA
jgi:hypothetical protein